MAQPPQTRRRLETEPAGESRVGRGCLIWGGVLGVIVGAAFAYYGLKPILKHFYGETTIAAGTSYNDNGKVIRVTRVETSSNASTKTCRPASNEPASIVCVTLNVSSNTPWPDLGAKQFTLQVASQHDWIDATSLNGTNGKPANIPAGSQQEVTVHFPAPADYTAANLQYLHLSNPRVRFALPR